MASSGSQSDSDSQAGKKPPSKAAPAIKGNSSGNGNRTTPPAAAINGSMLKRSLSLTPARSGIMSPGQSRSRSGDPRGAAENEKRKSSVGALVRSRNSVVGALPEATPSEIAAAKPSVLIQPKNEVAEIEKQLPHRLYTTVFYERPIVQKSLSAPNVMEASEMNVEAEKPAPIPQSTMPSSTPTPSTAPAAEGAKPEKSENQKSSMFGIGIFSLPIRGLRAASSWFYSKPKQREVESVSELKPSATSAPESSTGQEAPKEPVGDGPGSSATASPKQSESSELSVSGKEPSRIPRPMVQSVPANSPGAVGRTSKLAVVSPVLKLRDEIVSKMMDAVEKKQQPTEEKPPPVVYNNARVSFSPEDEEMDSMPDHLGEYDILLPMPHFDHVLNEAQSNIRVETAVNINIVRMLKRQAKIVHHSKGLQASSGQSSAGGKAHATSGTQQPLPSENAPSTSDSSGPQSQQERPSATTDQPSSTSDKPKGFPHDAQPSLFTPSMAAQQSEASDSGSSATDQNELQKRVNVIVDRLVSETLDTAMGKKQPVAETAVASDQPKSSPASTETGSEKAPLPLLTISSSEGDVVTHPPQDSLTEPAPARPNIYKRLVESLAADYAKAELVKLEHPSLEKPRGSQAREVDVAVSVEPLPPSADPQSGRVAPEDKKWYQLFNLAVNSLNSAMDGVKSRGLARDTVMQVTVRDVENDRLTPLMAVRTELLAANPTPINVTPIPISSTAPLRRIRQLHQLAENRYIDRAIWLQHFANKIKEIDVQVAPPEGTDEETASGTTPVEQRNEQQTDADAVPSETAGSVGSAPGPSFVERVQKHQIIEEAFEMRHFPSAGYEPQLSTAEEEKSDEIPKSSSSIHSSATGATYDMRIEFSSSYAPSTSDARSAVPETLTPSDTITSVPGTSAPSDAVTPVPETSVPTDAIISPTTMTTTEVAIPSEAPSSALEQTTPRPVPAISEPATMSLQSAPVMKSESAQPVVVKERRPPRLTGWDSSGPVDVREFIAQMMHPSPPMPIETIDTTRSNVQVGFVLVDKTGKVVRVCNSKPKPKDEHDLD